MNPANHIHEEDLALFALQILPEDEVRAVVSHLEHCESCRTQVGMMQGDLVSYAMTAEMHTPPAAVRERLLRRIGKEKKFVAPPVSNEPMLAARSSQLFTGPSEDIVIERRMGVAGWAGWAIAAGITVAAGLQFHQGKVLQGQLADAQNKIAQSQNLDKAQEILKLLGGSGLAPLEVSLHQPVPAGTPPVPKKPEAHVAYSAQNGGLVFVATNLDPLPPYKTYELWILPADKDLPPVPAGLFKPDANSSASLVMPEIPKGLAAKGFGVTVEDDGGSKQPTSAIVLAGF
jgi:anti-sigma-K factor RskA